MGTRSHHNVLDSNVGRDRENVATRLGSVSEEFQLPKDMREHGLAVPLRHDELRRYNPDSQERSRVVCRCHLRTG